MLLRKSLSLAWRSLLRNPARSLLAGVTIFVGGVVLFCSLCLGDGIAEGIVRNLVAIESGSALVTYRDNAPETRRAADFIDLHQQVHAALGDVPGVTGLRERLRFDALLFGPGGDSASLVVKGIEPARERQLADYLAPASGRMVGGGQREVYLSQQAARSLKVGVGEPVTLLLTTWGDQINAVDLTVSGIFGDIAPWVDYVAYVPLPVARQAFAADISNQYLLDTAQLSEAPAVVAASSQRLAGLPVDVRSYRSAGGFLLSIATANRYTFLAFSALLFFVVGIGIASLIGITVRERRPELGMLSAIGFESSQLVNLLVLEALLLAALATLGALLAGGAICFALSRHGIALEGVARNAFGSARLFPAAHGYQLGATVVACLLMALAGAFVPARRVLRLPAAEVFRKG